MIYQYVIAFLILSIPLSGSDDNGWVSVPRTEQKSGHSFQEEDPSIWVVFTKTLGPDRVMVRFPEDPVYRYADGYFEATATYLGEGEMTLIARLRHSTGAPEHSETMYRDAESGRLVMEKHISSQHYDYVLRLDHPSQSRALYQHFADSFSVL
jgi:hypothetical protein